jgi:hypothetical protein
MVRWLGLAGEIVRWLGLAGEIVRWLGLLLEVPQGYKCLPSSADPTQRIKPLI